MKIKYLLFTVVVFFLIHSYGFCDDTIEIPFEFSRSADADGSYALRWNDVTYELFLNSEGWLVPTQESLDEFPVHFLPAIQLMYELSQEDHFSPLEKIFGKIERRYTNVMPRDQLISYAIETAFLRQDDSRLREIIERLFGRLSPSQCGTTYLYLALLEPDWERQKEYLKQALSNSPSDNKILMTAQVFSLHIAEAILSHYRKLLQDAGIFKRLGMEGLQDRRPHLFWDAIYAVKQATVNTANGLTLLLTDYEDDLLTLWEAQMNELNQLRSAVRALRRVIEEEGIPLQNVIKNDSSSESLKHFSEGIKRFTRSSFYKEIAERGLYADEWVDNESVPYPSVRRIGLDTEVDFVNLDLRTILFGELNILNVWMIWRGPAAVRSFGQTRAGAGLVRILRLQRVVSALSKLPRPLDSVCLWLALETADGCLVRWAYTGIAIWNRLSSEEEESIREGIRKGLAEGEGRKE